MLKKLVLSLFGLLLVLPIVGAIAGIKFLQIRVLMAGGQQGEPPAAVAVGAVEAQEWERSISAVGSVASFQGIVLSAESEGTVREILFEAGTSVKAGDVLVRLDTEVERAQLRAAEAAAALAKTNLDRARDLLGSNTISKAEFDAADATLKQAEAQADNIRAVIAKKTIAAPFAGRLGIRQVSLGQFLNKGDPVVSLQALDPVYVEFSVPQQQLGVIEEGMEVRVRLDAFADRVFEGRLTAINPDIDPATRNVRVQATLRNPDGLLRPGMFVRVGVMMPEPDSVLVVPATSVVYAPYGNSVFVVTEGKEGPDGKKGLVAEQRFIRLGSRRGDFVAVTDGVKAGERIVTAGAFKLRQGMSIIPSSLGVPEPELNPTPADA